eukprot:15471880-Alexandrium_andersonii.AAC.1
MGGATQAPRRPSRGQQGERGLAGAKECPSVREDEVVPQPGGPGGHEERGRCRGGGGQGGRRLGPLLVLTRREAVSAAASGMPRSLAWP